jgi:hypothetical protein
MSSLEFTNYSSCKGVVLDSGEGEYVVRGTVATKTNDATILYWAANPPNYMENYSGSGLPFANPDIAFENTPNRGAVKANGGSFSFRVRYPNSYYVGLGTVLVEPCVHFKVCEAGSDNTVHTIKLGKGIPYRMDTYPAKRSTPLFYSGRDELPIRTQEEILRSYGFPEDNQMPTNHWGLKPPK